MIICDPGIKPKNRHLQSILASSKLRLLRLKKNNPIDKLSKESIIETTEAKLQGFYTPKKNSESLYILLHGWEGSAHSTYIQLLASVLYKQEKVAIFRLNFRDHGNSHHLNKEIFHSCRLNEIVEAIKQITEKHPHKNVYLCGYSLGANFCLRVAANAYKHNIKLTKVFAVSPPINPKNSMLAIEGSKLYSTYFMKKWKKSLSKKVKLFPEEINESKFKAVKSLKSLTEILIINHSEFASTDDYFRGYQITEKLIKEIKIPCVVITSWDDPVIPFKDFNVLKNKKNIKLVTSRLGGHCGFITSWKMDSWIEQYIIENSG